MRYHPGARPGNRDGASDLESEGGRARARGPFVSYLLGSRRGSGTGTQAGPQRWPPEPPTPALPGSTRVSFLELGLRGWGRTGGGTAAERAEP